MITAAEIRQRYIDFFVQRDHRHALSAPLVPPDDPTLLFTTAGMVQFKAYYSGAVPLPYTRAVTVQKCLRAGGKGSDLENVGRTLRHHTFFEMLGNFSFGDYFKREAIAWAWEFCTGREWLGLPGDRIWPTIFGKPDGAGGWTVDSDAEKFWLNETGVVNPIIRLDEHENFWGPAGGAGACGACSEIKFFMGSDEELREYQELGKTEAGLKQIAHDIVEKGDLFLEIWNLVFPEFDHQPDGSRPLLKNKGIDTGAGLERVTTACQMWHGGGKVASPYETDLLEPLIHAISEMSHLPYPRLRGDELNEARLRDMGRVPDEVRLAMNACADHARTLTFALAEGIVPSNEGRGYVIRRILRRAARFGRKIGIVEPFLHRLVDPVVRIMGDVYPELKSHPAQIVKTIRAEEERFQRTLTLGIEMLEGMLKDRKPGHEVTGEEAYRLYDTYGFPMDLTMEVAEERGLTVDADGFDLLLAEGKKRARASWKGGSGIDLGQFVQQERKAGRKTAFVGHTEFTAHGSVVVIVRDGQRADSLEDGQTGIVVLDRTPFYGEGGGQVGDQGVLVSEEGIELFRVEDTQKTDDGYVFHFGQALNHLAAGHNVEARIDAERRWATMKHHSATHLLQGALKRLIGGHVTQAGSHVNHEHLRFDFTNPEALPDDKLREIEWVVNEQVQKNIQITAKEMDIEEARSTGAIAPFGEKYGARVRVIRMGDFSTEFCGGTHLSATGEIGPFIITSETSVAAGIRRIEAKTGQAAAAAIAHERGILARLSRSLTATPDQLPDRVASLQSEIKTLKRQIEQERARALSGQAGEFTLTDIGDAHVCAAWVDGADLAALRSVMDGIKSKHQDKRLLVVLGSDGGGKATLVAGVTDNMTKPPLAANNVVNALAPLFDGRGGGKPQFAQAGGSDASRLKAALESGEAMEIIRGLK